LNFEFQPGSSAVWHVSSHAGEQMQQMGRLCWQVKDRLSERFSGFKKFLQLRRSGLLSCNSISFDGMMAIRRSAALQHESLRLSCVLLINIFKFSKKVWLAVCAGPSRGFPGTE
jgi:hypothetical protein